VVANCLHTVPFLYDHFQDVGAFVDVSVNATVSGPVPLNGVAVKLATGFSLTRVTVI
jgi:hypothetical protein